ncbi:hypothetical protein [Nonomuraea rhizosphaerae]|uniref:hypothetical protein n=1 Tax=Nonomuraea rhizosphaerae TaxID=2665663 RepID=UPI001C5D13BA|nr:hypothetical protein [Nonomuraea rhizosphaerae]
MHWHAYTWLGNDDERGREDERRPGSAEFAGSHVPPMRTGDWLARPAARIRASFEDPARAVEWLEAQYGQIRGAFLHPDRIGPGARLEAAADALPRGVDVQWGEWLTGGRFAAISVICCPNRHVPHPCPIRRP